MTIQFGKIYRTIRAWTIFSTPNGQYGLGERTPCMSNGQPMMEYDGTFIPIKKIAGERGWSDEYMVLLPTGEIGYTFASEEDMRHVSYNEIKRKKR